MCKIKILTGDNIELLKGYPDNYFDSVVTDCPYGLGKEPNANKLMQDWIDHGYHEVKGVGFMGKSWDAFVPQPIFWKEIFRVLKPGGYVLAFFGTRTYDWGTLAIRMAGFEIRDMICWHYGSGFPKSLDISKQLDKMAGTERIKGKLKFKGGSQLGVINDDNWKPKDVFETSAVCDKAKEWEGYGTALKPATEPIAVARKPLDGTVAENVLKYGTGGINLDGCRMDTVSPPKSFGNAEPTKHTYGTYAKRTEEWATDKGRFPANVILDDFTGNIMDEQSGISGDKRTFRTEAKGDSVISKTGGFGIQGGRPVGFETPAYGDFGGASRFFYCAKTSQDERHLGCEHLNAIKTTDGRFVECDNAFQRGATERLNNHPTVKPISLMRYLQRLVTPKGGITLDPFAGSGTSGCSASFEDIGEIVLMEGEETYIPIIEARTKYWSVEKNRRNYLDGIKDKPVEPIKNQTQLFE